MPKRRLEGRNARMENLNKYIKDRMGMLRASSRDFAGLFEVIHDQEDRVFCEFLSNFQIRRITYASFKDYCYRTASWLSGRIGDQPGAFVGIRMENSAHFIACFWALLMLGYKPLLINCRLPDVFNKKIASLMGVKTVLATKELPSDKGETKILLLPAGSSPDEEILACPPYRPTAWANELALTSTATSLNWKICVYTGADLFCQILNAEGVLKKNAMVKKHYKGCLKLLTFLPFYHIFGLTALYFWFSVFGRTFVFLNDYSSETILKTVRRHGVTHIFAVPLLWNTLASEIKKELAAMPEKKRKKAGKAMRLTLFLQNISPVLGMRAARKIFSQVTSRTFGNSISFMISGGGCISNETLYMLNAVGYPLFNGYGSTELGITSVELRRTPKHRIRGSVGKPFDSVEYRLEDGTLFVRGDSTCSRIVDSDGKTFVINKKEWFDTRDSAEADRDGYYYIRGRKDDVVIGENGEKIDPDLIEKRCLFTTVNNFSALDLDGKLTLIFEIPRGAGELKKKAIAEEIGEALEALKRDGFAIGQVFFTFDPLHSENAIKVSRTVLKAQIARGGVTLRPIGELKTYTDLTDEQLCADTRKGVREVFAETLGIEESAIKDDMHFIFDLGGTSLDYCTVLIKLQNKFGVEFSFDKQSCASAREFAQYIMNTQSGGQDNEKIQKS